MEVKSADINANFNDSCLFYGALISNNKPSGNLDMAI